MKLCFFSTVESKALLLVNSMDFFLFVCLFVFFLFFFFIFFFARLSYVQVGTLFDCSSSFSYPGNNPIALFFLLVFFTLRSNPFYRSSFLYSHGFITLLCLLLFLVLRKKLWFFLDEYRTLTGNCLHMAYVDICRGHCLETIAAVYKIDGQAE